VQAVLTSRLHTLGLRSWQLQLASLMGVAMCIVLWLRAKTLDQDERGNAERRALFAGLWPPTLWGISQSLERHERQHSGAGRLLARSRNA
jgi:hypothetical protein